MRFNAQAELRRIRDETAFPGSPIPPRGMSVAEWIAAGKPSANDRPAKKKTPKAVHDARRDRWSHQQRCLEYSDNQKKPYFLRRKGGKVCYAYLDVVRAARREKVYFYMCPTGDHWHLTSSDRWGAVPGKMSTRQRRAT